MEAGARPHSTISGGYFELERKFLYDFECYFPSCEGAARESSNRLVQKLNFYRGCPSPNIAIEASFKLTKGFLQNKSRWANPAELASSSHNYFAFVGCFCQNI